MEQQGLQGPRIALLIDFDNVVLGVDDPPGFDVELVVNALRSRGVVVLGRAYGDWYRHNRHRRKLMEQGIELVETPAFGPIIKNSADIRIALDAFEIGMTQNHISHFCLVSGDSDFLPLVKRLQLLGKTVIVIAGNKFTSELIRRNCNEYVSYENLLAESVGATEDATTLEGAYALLNRTVNTMNERGQDARSSAVKQMMLQLNPVFSERSFGCSQFKQFLNKACGAGIIRLGNRDGDSGEYLVRLIDDNGDTGETSAPTTAPEKPLISDLETAPVRSRKSTSAAKSSASKSATKSEATVEAPTDDGGINLAEEIANNASTVSPARRGRLRFSGRTWRSNGTSTKAAESTNEASDETAEEAAAPETTAPADATAAKTASTKTEKKADKADETAKDTTATKVNEVKSDKAEKTEKANKKAEESKPEKASEATEAEASAEKPTEESAPAEEEEKPKKKAPARRRTSSRATTAKSRSTKAKKAESDAEASPAAAEAAKEDAAKAEDKAEEKKTATDSAAEDAAADKAAKSAEKEAPKAEAETEEKKPKRKTPVRRRTSSRTTKKKTEEKEAESAETTDAKSPETQSEDKSE